MRVKRRWKIKRCKKGVLHRFPNLKVGFILASPPFNVSDWGGERLREDKRWKFGGPLVGNATVAWVQHIVHHMAPTGLTGFVLANGSMSSNQSGEVLFISFDNGDCRGRWFRRNLLARGGA